MTKLEVEENFKLSFSKRRKKTQTKENENNEDTESEKIRKGKEKEDNEPVDRKGKKKGKGKKGGKEEFEELKEPSEEKIEALAIVPPDGGWGWVVVFCSFTILVCSDGSINSFGVFSYHIEDDFNVTVGETSTIAAVAACLYYVCGPVWGALGNRYGFRTILIIGAGFMAAGNIAGFFIEQHFIPFAVLYSVGIGVGGGMVCMSVYVMVGVYFERWRGYATSMISCGSSVGTVFMPPAYNSVEVYGWRYVLLLNCILMSCCMLLGILVRPLKPTLVTATVRPEQRQVQFTEHKLKGKKPKKGQAAAPPHQELMRTSSFVTLKGVGIAPSSTSVYISTAEVRPPSSPPTEEQLDESGARPLYRETIFYPASAARLGSQTLYRSSAFSLMRLPTVEDSRERVPKPPCRCCPPCCPHCPHGVRRAFATLLDTSLMRSPVFLGITVSQTISILGYHAPFLFTYARAKHAGMKPEHSSWLIPLLGIANTIGRLLCGAIVELPHVNALQLTSVSFAIGGLFTIISCVDLGYRLQFAYVVVFGLMAACIFCRPLSSKRVPEGRFFLAESGRAHFLEAAFMAMKSIILVDYLGIERLTNAFGLLLMFQGVAALCGPPLAGFIADATHSYNNAFYCAGTIAFIGGLSGFLVIPLKNYEIKKGMRDR